MAEIESVAACEADIGLSIELKKVPEQIRRSAGKQTALASAAGQTIDSSPPSQAFIVAVISHNCISTSVSTTHKMPLTMIVRSCRERGRVALMSDSPSNPVA